MEAANAAPPPPPPAAAFPPQSAAPGGYPSSGGYPTPSLGAPAGSPVSDAPRRSRFSAPKSKEEVDAELAAAAGFPAAPPALAHAGSSGMSGSFDRSGGRSHTGGSPDDRRRSRSRSRERDQPNSRSDRGGPGNAPGGGSGGGRGGTGAQNPGFVRLPESEQSGSTWVKVLSTTLRVNHEKLATLGMDQNSLRNQLRSSFQNFGTVDWLNVTDTTSYVRFRTRRSAALAKSGSDGLSVGASVSAPVRLSWAKAKEMDKGEMTQQHRTATRRRQSQHSKVRCTAIPRRRSAPANPAAPAHAPPPCADRSPRPSSVLVACCQRLWVAPRLWRGRCGSGQPRAQTDTHRGTGPIRG